jgi:hypothetical protein
LSNAEKAGGRLSLNFLAIRPDVHDDGRLKDMENTGDHASLMEKVYREFSPDLLAFFRLAVLRRRRICCRKLLRR